MRAQASLHSFSLRSSWSFSLIFHLQDPFILKLLQHGQECSFFFIILRIFQLLNALAPKFVFSHPLRLFDSNRFADVFDPYP